MLPCPDLSGTWAEVAVRKVQGVSEVVRVHTTLLWHPPSHAVFATAAHVWVCSIQGITLALPMHQLSFNNDVINYAAFVRAQTSHTA